MGRVIRFPNRPECPPHDWVAIYDEDSDPPDDEAEFIAGRVCVKCSLIESKESLALMLAAQEGGGQLGYRGGKGEGFLALQVRPTFGSDRSPRDYR